MRKINGSLKRWKKYLEEIAPLPYSSVSVRLVKSKTLEKDFGEFEEIDGKCFIRINETLGVEQQKEILVHEWAHAVCDFILSTVAKSNVNMPVEFIQDHGTLWALCYSSIYKQAYCTL